jgi:hypothetical protein
MNSVKRLYFKLDPRFNYTGRKEWIIYWWFNYNLGLPCISVFKKGHNESPFLPYPLYLNPLSFMLSLLSPFSIIPSTPFLSFL